MWLLFVLHKVFPPLFVLFLNSLPVIACTTLLLGVLLIHSEPNTLKHELGSDRTKKDSVTESLGFRNEEGLEAKPLVLSRRAARRTIVRRAVSSATCANSDSCFEEVSDKKDADSDEWHELDREQDEGPSDFKSVVDDDKEASDSSVASAASSVDEGDVGEAYGERDGEKSAVSWSEDDQRILVQIGNSELERNRQLERVIAIRKARLMMVDKNLTDMDDNGGDEKEPTCRHCSINVSSKNPLEEHPHSPTISKENLSNTVPTSQSKPCLGFRMDMVSEQSSCSSDEVYEEPESDSSNSHNQCESTSSEANKKPEKLVASDSDAAEAVQFCWFAQSLASVDEHESLSREVSVIEEADVIGHEMYRARRGSGGPVVRAVPAPAAAKKTLLRSSVVSMRM